MNSPATGAETRAQAVAGQAWARPESLAIDRTRGDPNSAAISVTQNPCDVPVRATVQNRKRTGIRIFFIGVRIRTYSIFRR